MKIKDTSAFSLIGKKAVIFDMDGTIIDTMNIWDVVDTVFFERRGLPVPPDYLDSVSTMSFMENAIYTIKRFSLKEKPEDILSEWAELADKEYTQNAKLLPYVREYFELLKKHGIKIALATGAIKRFYEKALIGNGVIDYFDALCSVEDVGRGKSFPDVYYLAMEKLSVEPSETIIFEDVEGAAVTAAKTGATVCLINSKTDKQIDGVHIIPSFKEVLLILQTYNMCDL